MTCPSKLIAKPGLLRAFWYVLTGRLKAYCHIKGCPYGEGQVSLFKKCRVCGYSFKTALKMLRVLKEIQSENVQEKQG